jgi:hypothetical protein
MECARFEYAWQVAVVCEQMNTPGQLSNKRLGVGVGSGSARCLAGMRDHQLAPQIMAGDELNPFAVAYGSGVLHQTDVRSLIIADAPAIIVRSGDATMFGELGQ